LREHKQIDIVVRKFDDFASQCNFGLTRVQTEWVLSLDADYELSDELVKEIAELTADAGISGYQVGFTYRIYGTPLRGSLYPARTVLYRKAKGFYQNEGHGHRVVVSGAIEKLKGVIYHDDRKSVSRWVISQRRYAEVEAQNLLNALPGNMSTADRIRRMAWPAPILVFFYTLFAKGCIFSGWAGWYYVLQRVLAETLIALEIVDRDLRNPPSTKEK